MMKMKMKMKMTTMMMMLMAMMIIIFIMFLIMVLLMMFSVSCFFVFSNLFFDNQRFVSASLREKLPNEISQISGMGPWPAFRKHK